MKILSLLGPQRQTVARMGATAQVGEWVYQVLTPEGIVDLPEDTAKRTKGCKVFTAGTDDKTGKKQYVSEATVGPRHYKADGLTSQGDWLDVDTSPANPKGLYRLEYPDGNRPCFRYQSREGGEWITVRLDLPAGYDWKQFTDEGDRRTWKDVWPDVDIQLRLWPDRVGVYKVLKTDRAQHTFTFDVSAKDPDGTAKSPAKLLTASGVLDSKAAIDTALANGVTAKQAEYAKAVVRDLLAWDASGNALETSWTLKGTTRTETIPVQDAKAYPLTVDTDVTEQVGASADDGYISSFNSSINTTDTNMPVGATTLAQLSWFARWTSVVVDGGADNIDSAYVSYKCGYSASGTSCITRIYFNDADDAAAPTTYAEYTGKAVTSAYVGWTIPAWTVNTWYNSPDITDVLQEIVARPGWSSGNDMMVLHKNNGSTANAYRYSYTYNSAAANAPKLVFAWSSGATTHDCAASLKTDNDLAATARLSLSVSAALASKNALTAGASMVRQAAAAFETSNALTAAASRVILASAAFRSANALAAAATYLHAAQAALESVNTLAAAGIGVLQGAAALEAQNVLAAAATHIHAAIAELESVNDLAATGTAIQQASAALESVNTLVASAGGTIDAAAALVTANALTAAATRVQAALAALESINTLTAAGTLVQMLGAGLAIKNNLAATAVIVQQLAADFETANALTAAGTLVKEAAADLRTDNDLGAAGTLIVAASAALDSHNALAANATATYHLAGAFEATMTLTATLTRVSGSTLQPPFRVSVGDTRTYARVDDLRVTVRVDDTRTRAEAADTRTRTEAQDTRTRVVIE